MRSHFITIKIAIPALMLLAAVSAHAGTPATLKQLPPIAPGIAAMPRLVGNPGDASIERINFALTKEDASVQALAAECKETGGAQSQYSRNVTVAMRGPQYLSILASDDWYCGGAHPDAGNTSLVYDLATGAPVDWKKILPAILVEQSANHDDPTHAPVISATLTQLYMESKTDSECREALAGGPDLEFALWPDASANGISIQPQNLPHVIAACGMPFTIGVPRLQSLGVKSEFLNAIDEAHRQGWYDKPRMIAQAAEGCDAPGLIQAELNECYGNIYKKADAQLNVLYRQITDRLKDDEATTKLLVSAQRAWVAFRDTECNFSSSGVSGGTAFGMIQAICLTKVTDKRIDDFKGYLNCQEGALDCPVPAR